MAPDELCLQKTCKEEPSMFKRLRNILPWTKENPDEQKWQQNYFWESLRCELRLLILTKRADFLFNERRRGERKVKRQFEIMDHPLSGVRQVADWYSLGPRNPPPAVRAAIDALSASAYKNKSASTKIMT